LHSGSVHKYCLLILATAVLFSVTASGQITSATASYLDSVAYPVTEGKDPLFVFYQPATGTLPGDLVATHPDGGARDFEWTKYDPGLPGFGAPFRTESGVQSSTVTELEDGGYRVRITNGGGADTAFMAWVMLDRLQVRIDQTADGKVPENNYICELLQLYGHVEADILFVYDPTDHTDLTRVLDRSFEWTSDNEELTLPGSGIHLSPYNLYSPPYEDTWFILTAKDEMGRIMGDSVFYVSIQTKAQFSLRYYNKFSGAFSSEMDGSWKAPNFDDLTTSSGMRDATLTVQFVNESKNGAEFHWILLDTLGGVREEVVTYDTIERPEFTYMTADKYYYPYLYSYSARGCPDSVKWDEGIYVEPSELQIPNVFSPNGDHQNDIWYFKHQSLKTCRITVVDRTGKAVYKQMIDDIYSWEGWNGNINGSDRPAPEGIYYYVVQAEGYDGITYEDPSLWSQMKIFGGPGTKKTPDNTGTSPGGTGTGTETASQGRYTGFLYLFRH
jgi:gliding motility-associated-like protein